MKSHRSRRDGVALVLSLLILTILIVIVGQMSSTYMHNKSITDNFNADLQNSYALKSIYYQALIYLQDDYSKAQDVDALGEEWAKKRNTKIGDANVVFQIEDEERKLNLSFIVDTDKKKDEKLVERFKRLVENLGWDERYADMIIDYIDPDSDGDFEVGASNSIPLSVDELMRIKDMKPEVIYGGEVEGEKKKGIGDFITFVKSIQQKQPSDGKDGDKQPPQQGKWLININTASPEVIASLSRNMTIDIANYIVQYREEIDINGKPREIKNIADIKNVPGMTDAIYNEIQGLLGVKSKYFLIKGRSRIGNLEKGWLYTVYRADVIELITNIRMNDFFRVVKPEGKE